MEKEDTQQNADGPEVPAMEFADGIPEYLDGCIGYINDLTMQERARKLRMMGMEFAALHDAGVVSSTDPREITEADVRQYVNSLKTREKPIQICTMKKYLQILKGYLEFWNNDAGAVVLSKLRLNAPVKPVITLSDDELRKVFAYIDGMHGWNGSIVRGMIYLSYITGARPGEIRDAKIQDVDLIRERFYIRHPKGMGAFADQCYVPMNDPSLVPEISKYIDERALYLAQKGAESDILFPHVTAGKVSGYAMQSVQRKIQEVSDATGLEFSMYTFRKSAGNNYIAKNPNLLPMVSKMMRHGSIGTTERFYEGTARANYGKVLRENSSCLGYPRNEPGEDHDLPERAAARRFGGVRRVPPPH